MCAEDTGMYRGRLARAAHVAEHCTSNATDLWLSVTSILGTNGRAWEYAPHGTGIWACVRTGKAQTHCHALYPPAWARNSMFASLGDVYSLRQKLPKPLGRPPNLERHVATLPRRSSRSHMAGRHLSAGTALPSSTEYGPDQAKCRRGMSNCDN